MTVLSESLSFFYWFVLLIGNRVTDIWTGKSLGCVKGGIGKFVDSHDTIGYVVGKRCDGWPWSA